MIPTFIDLNEPEQCDELRVHFNEHLGANLKKVDTEGFYKDLENIINVCELCFQEEKDADKEAILNTIVSILIQVPSTEKICTKLVNSFCNKLYEAPENILPVALKVLNILFEGVLETPLRYEVYCSMLKVAGKIKQVHLVYSDIDQIKQLFNKETIGIDKVQNLLRLLHEVLKNEQNGESSKIMIELLSTYTEENASQARDDAQRCIITFISDPNTFLMDHLLTLKPVKFLEGELIHDLLTIFVSEKLSSYVSFHEKHKDALANFGLSHEQNLHKMRLLTFMQMAENEKDLSFGDLEKELRINENEVEQFVIDVLKTKLVRAKVDQSAKTIHVSSTMHRTFGKQQWQQLRDTLVQWQNNLANVHQTIANALAVKFDQSFNINQIQA